MRGMLAIPLRYWLVFRSAVFAFIITYLLEACIFMLGFGFGLEKTFTPATTGMPYSLFVISGMMIWTGATVAIIAGGFECHRSLYDRKIWQGMLAASLTTRDIVLGETMGILLRCLIASVLVFAAGIMFGKPLPVMGFLISLPLFIITYLIFISVCFIAIAFLEDRSKLFLLWALLGTPTLAFGNTVMPIEHYPSWLHPLAQLLPSTHSLEVIRHVWLGQTDPMAYLITFSTLLGIWILLTTVAVLSLKRRLLV